MKYLWFGVINGVLVVGGNQWSTCGIFCSLG